MAFALSDDTAPPVPGEAPSPGGLTRREREVAALVAGGMTNREIAERLVISKRTADTHVEHILAKLGVSSRAQIAPPVRAAKALDRWSLRLRPIRLLRR